MPAVASAAGHDTLPLATENRSFSIPFYEYQLLRNQAKADEKERATQKLHARRIAINKELGQFSVQERAEIQVLTESCTKGADEVVTSTLKGLRRMPYLLRVHLLQSGLMAASGYGHINLVRTLLDAKADVNRASPGDLQDTQPLQAAVACGHQDIARLLLSRGADPDLLSGHGWAPLHTAIHITSMPMVKLLLEHKADVNLCTAAAEAYAPLHFVIFCMTASRRSNAPDDDEPAPPLDPLEKQRVRSAHVALLSTLLEAKADPNGRAGFRYTPLHLVCNSSDVEVAQLLLDHKADPNLGAHNGSTALHISIHHHHDSLAMERMRGLEEMMLAHQQQQALSTAPPSSSSSPPPSPLSPYTQQRPETLIQLLLRYGASGAAMDHGITPLIIACEYGSADVVKWLVDAGHSPQQGRFLDRTPLQWAQHAAQLAIDLAQQGGGAQGAQVQLRGGAPRSGCVALVTRAIKRAKEGGGSGQGASSSASSDAIVEVDDAAAKAAAIARADAIAAELLALEEAGGPQDDAQGSGTAAPSKSARKKQQQKEKKRQQQQQQQQQEQQQKEQEQQQQQQQQAEPPEAAEPQVEDDQETASDDAAASKKKKNKKGKKGGKGPPPTDSETASIPAKPSRPLELSDLPSQQAEASASALGGGGSSRLTPLSEAPTVATSPALTSPLLASSPMLTSPPLLTSPSIQAAAIEWMSERWPRLGRRTDAAVRLQRAALALLAQRRVAQRRRERPEESTGATDAAEASAPRAKPGGGKIVDGGLAKSDAKPRQGEAGGGSRDASPRPPLSPQAASSEPPDAALEAALEASLHCMQIGRWTQAALQAPDEAGKGGGGGKAAADGAADQNEEQRLEAFGSLSARLSALSLSQAAGPTIRLVAESQ